jgi:7-keto-8-aminopelargonate synthetase-like enzyme
MQELESQLREARDAPMKLIASDGAFSMDGSIAPLRYSVEPLVYR